MLGTRKQIPFVLLIVFTVGCSNGNPKTFHVHGVVRFPDGLPLTAGSIEFEPLDRAMPFTARIVGGSVTAELMMNAPFESFQFQTPVGPYPADAA